MHYNQPFSYELNATEAPPTYTGGTETRLDQRVQYVITSTLFLAAKFLATLPSVTSIRLHYNNMGSGYMLWFVGYLDHMVRNPSYIVLFIIFYMSLFAFSIWYSGKKKRGPNPFNHDTSRRPGKLITDPKLRNRIIKQGGTV